MTTPTHYDVLSLPSPRSNQTSNSEPLDLQTLKRHYRRALLSHHPDKSFSASSTSPSHHQNQNQHQNQTQNQTQTQKKPKYTIDQISLAYATLSSPSLKAAYDKSLLLLQDPHSYSSSSQNNNNNNDHHHHHKTGIETADLDDLDHDPESQEWYRPCRCGNPRGFRFAEADLEDASDLGELMVGCADCSLWLRVCFAVVDDGDEDEDEDGEKKNDDNNRGDDDDDDDDDGGKKNDDRGKQ